MKDGTRGFFFVATVLALGLAVTSSPHLPSGLLPGWLRNQYAVYSAIWPQGWGFFAKTPDAGMIVIFREGSHGERQMVNIHHLSVANRWGLGKKSDALLAETMYVTDRTPTRAWRACAHPDGLVCDDAATDFAAYVIANDFPDATLCGPLLLVYERPDAAGESAVGYRSAAKTAAVWLTCP